MSIDEIVKKISSQAAQEKEEVTQAARQAVKEIEKETETGKRELKEEYDHSLERQKKENRDRVQSKARQEVKRSIESLRREALDSVFNDALRRLIGLNSTDYQKVIVELLSTVELNDRSVTVFAPRNRVEETTAALKQHSLSPQTVTEDETLDGGVVIKGEDVEFDLSFNSLIRSIQNRHETEVAAILFSA